MKLNDADRKLTYQITHTTTSTTTKEKRKRGNSDVRPIINDKINSLNQSMIKSNTLQNTILKSS